MNMIDAFKRLLDGQKITRTEWGDVYIVRDERNNCFELKIGGSNSIRPIKYVSFEKTEPKRIEFKYSIDDEQSVILLDDNKNVIHVSREERIELSAKKWEIKLYTFARPCDKCLLKSLCNKGASLCSISHVNELSPEKVRHIYNLIKGEE